MTTDSLTRFTELPPLERNSPPKTGVDAEAEAEATDFDFNTGSSATHLSSYQLNGTRNSPKSP